MFAKQERINSLFDIKSGGSILNREHACVND